MRGISSKIIKIETAVAGFSLATSTTLIFLAAVARSFDRPINWSLDISLFLFAWATFLAADVAFREDKLVNVDVLVERLPPKPAKMLRIVTMSLIVAFLVLIGVYGILLSYRSRQRAFQGIPSVSYSWVTLSLPVGAILLTQTAITKLLALVREPTTGPDTDDGRSEEKG